MEANQFDVVIVGGGPGGLAASCALGRARRRVLLVDSGPPRNAKAVEIHNFVTRDGIAPADFRRIGREQLVPYTTVDVRDARVDEITRTKDAFEVRIGGDVVVAKRILLATGMIDEMLPIEGFDALWESSIYQCPYCHGWEVRDRPFAFLPKAPAMLDFAIMLRNWTPDVTVVTNGAFPIPEDAAARLAKAKIPVDERRIARLVGTEGHIQHIEFTTDASLPLAALFTHPPQRHVPVVAKLDLELDPMGFVKVTEPSKETSRPGIHAAGDLMTMMQGAILAAANGTIAGSFINHELSLAPFITAH